MSPRYRDSQSDLFAQPAKPRDSAPLDSKPLDRKPPDSAAFDAARAAAAALAPVPAVPGSAPSSAATVSTLTRLARDVVEGSFTPLWIRGEVTDFKAHRNGQWYFCLRDEHAQIRCVVWSKEALRIATPPVDGRQIAARGQLTVYPARGEMQFAVTAVEHLGAAGIRRAVVERTLRTLDAAGLLDPTRKRPLPRFPRRIAVVTSPDGAALRDIIAVTRRRAPSVQVVVVPAQVQGEGAPEALCGALGRVSRWGDADIVIIGRGGGGRDDLVAFDDERVARALAACPMPTISAVGHEIDLSVCDLVADLRAPTPSAAAEAAVPVETDLAFGLKAAGQAVRSAVERRLREAHAELSGSVSGVHRAAAAVVERRAGRLTALAGQVHALSPLATLQRGYAVARRVDGGPALTRAEHFVPGEPFDLVVSDGTVRARVETKSEPTP